MKKLLYILTISVFFSSCASVFAPAKQKVTVTKPKGSEVLVNDKKPTIKKGKYVLSKRQRATQFKVSKEGYKDQYQVFGTYKPHILRYVLGIPFSVITFGYSYFLDHGVKAKNYDKEIELGDKLILIPNKSNQHKEIQINNVSANISSENIKQRYFSSFKRYYKRNEKEEEESIENIESIDVENTIFTNSLNEILKESGYIDTSNKALKNSYANNLYLNAKLSGVTFHYVYQLGFRMIYTDLTIDWEVLDYYKKPVYSLTTTESSGEFMPYDGQDVDELINLSVNDAVEVSLLKFLNKNKVQELLSDQSVAEEEKNFEPIELPASSNHVNDISEALKSSVTIKSNSGHGSGFVVSPDGHIITSYYVVADTNDLKVVLNNGEEYDANIIRVSKVNNLALVKIDKSNLTPFSFDDSEEIEIGQTIYAVGTPNSTSLSQSISKGIISGVRTNDAETRVIQTDVSINRGNNGGAIIDENGVVVGMVSSKLVGSSVEGVAFGIPSMEIFKILKLN